MRYQVLILMAKEKLAAMDIDAEGKAEMISIEGNEVMKYRSADGVKDFCRYLKDYYNIEYFSDIDLSVTVVRFDALQPDTVCLFEEIKDADECNLVSVEKLLPLLLLKESAVKPDKTVRVEIFGCTYLVKMSSDLKVECKKGGEGKDKLELPVERLSLYYCFDANNLIDNKSELKKCQEELHRELEEKKDLLNKLKEMQEEKARADIAEKKIGELLQIIDRVKEQKNKSMKRYICRFQRESYTGNPPDTSVPTNIGNIFSMFRVGALIGIEYRIDCTANNLDVVIKNHKIAVAKAYSNGERMSNFDINIKAAGDGRIFYLVSQDSAIKEGNVIALIGDLSDSREEIVQWYEKNKQ